MAKVIAIYVTLYFRGEKYKSCWLYVRYSTNFVFLSATMSRILAIDYGDSRTGLATCDRTEFLTSPITPQNHRQGPGQSRRQGLRGGKRNRSRAHRHRPAAEHGRHRGERARKSRKLAKTVEIWSGLPSGCGMSARPPAPLLTSSTRAAPSAQSGKASSTR